MGGNGARKITAFATEDTEDTERGLQKGRESAGDEKKKNRHYCYFNTPCLIGVYAIYCICVIVYTELLAVFNTDSIVPSEGVIV